MIRASVLPLMVFVLFGCRANPGSDPLLVNAQKGHQLAFEAVKAFLDIESDNQVIIKDKLPQIHQFAERLRTKGEDGRRMWEAVFEDAWTGIENYRKTRNPADGVTMNNLMAAVRALQDTIQPYLVDMATEKADKRRTPLKGAIRAHPDDHNGHHELDHARGTDRAEVRGALGGERRDERREASSLQRIPQGCVQQPELADGC